MIIWIISATEYHIFKFNLHWLLSAYIAIPLNLLHRNIWLRKTTFWIYVVWISLYEILSCFKLCNFKYTFFRYIFISGFWNSDRIFMCLMFKSFIQINIYQYARLRSKVSSKGKKETWKSRTLRKSNRAWMASIYLLLPKLLTQLIWQMHSTWLGHIVL